MANKDIIIIQEQSDGSYNELKVSPQASSVLVLDASQNPTTILQSELGSGGGGGTVDYRYALQFDGNNYMQSPAITLTSGTIEFWFTKTANGGGMPRILCFEMDALDISTGGILGSSSDLYLFSSGWHNVAPNSIQINEPMHIAICNNGTTTTTFVNGVQKNSISDSWNVSSWFRLGLKWNGGEGLPCIIDELRISNVVRYNSDFAPPLYHPLDSNTLIYYKFDESSGTTAFDSSGNSNDGTLVGEPAPTWATGIGNRALQFDGTQNYVTIDVNGSQSSLEPMVNSDATVECWIKTTGATGSLCGTQDSNYNGWSLFLYNGAAYFYFPGLADDPVGWGRTAQGTTIINDDKWHHIAGTWNRSTNTLGIWVDGVLDGTAVANSNTYLTGSSGLKLGRQATGSDSVSCILDEFRISSALRYSSTFIPTKGYILDSDTKAYWRMNEGEGTTIYDISGNGHHGTLNGSPKPTWVNLPNSKALQFDGSQNYATVPYDSAFDLISTNSTIELWSKLNRVDNVCLISHCGDTGNYARWALVSGSGNLYCYISSGWGGAYIYAPTPNDSNWHHYAITRVGDETNLWIDGVSVASGTLGLDYENAPIYIGMWRPSDPIRLDGFIDEVRISSVARYTTAFVPSTSFVPDANTIAYWKCDDGTGTTLTDSSGNGHNGTLMGSPKPTWITGV